MYIHRYTVDVLGFPDGGLMKTTIWKLLTPVLIMAFVGCGGGASSGQGVSDLTTEAIGTTTTLPTGTTGTTGNGTGADPGTGPVANPGTGAFLISYNPDAGRLLGSQCAQCHGTDGISVNEWDSIAGAQDLADEMFSDDEPIMRAQAHGYTPEEIALLQAWLSTLPGEE
jgi:cytochrome c553